MLGCIPLSSLIINASVVNMKPFNWPVQKPSGFQEAELADQMLLFAFGLL